VPATAVPPIIELPISTIEITAPAPNTLVANPLALSGRLNYRPAQNQLQYTITFEDGSELGRGTINLITPRDNSGAVFDAQLPYRIPPRDGRATVVVSDSDANSGQTIASASIEVRVQDDAYPYPAGRPQVGRV
jgi:hypothetical protein